MYTWNDDYSVNVSVCDKEHQKLFRLMDELAGSMNNVKSELLAHTIYELISYASEHFANEEQLMETNEYPALEQHKKDHDRFKERIQDFVVKFSDDNEALAKEVLEYLRNWLVNHIIGVDKKYGPYLNERGIK